MGAATWGALATGVLGLFGLLIKAYLAGEPKRDGEKHDEETQADRAAIASGDAVALGAAIDSVPTASAGDPAGLGTDSDTARRIAEVTGG